MIVFVAAAIMSVIGAIASLVMGGKYVHADTASVPGADRRGDEPTRSAMCDDEPTRPATDAERLALVVGRLNRRMQAATGGLSHGLLSTLAVVAKHGPLRLSDLAQLESVSAPSMTRTIAELESRGYVVRRADPVDGRAVLIAAAEAGHGGHRSRLERPGRRSSPSCSAYFDSQRSGGMPQRSDDRPSSRLWNAFQPAWKPAAGPERIGPCRSPSKTTH